MNKYNVFTLLIVIFVLNSLTIFAHPGRTDSNGCHTCRTNCEKYGIEYGFYHRHNPVRPCFEERVETIPTLPKTKEPTPIVTKPTDASLEQSQQIPLTMTEQPKINESKSLYKVVSVTDGDTIKIEINKKIENVRLLGIDSPETYKKQQCFGKEATTYLINLLKDKFVRLEKDSIQPDKDRFGRLLRYIYLEDGTLINEEMVRNGYAFAYTKYNSDKLKDFIKLEKQSKNEKLGLWNSCSILSRIIYYISNKD